MFDSAVSLRAIASSVKKSAPSRKGGFRNPPLSDEGFVLYLLLLVQLLEDGQHASKFKDDFSL
jgi:hypothetical protein